MLIKFINKHIPIDVHETQWKKLPFTKWYEYFVNDFPSNLLEFQPKVYNFKDAAGTLYYK